MNFSRIQEVRTMLEVGIIVGIDRLRPFAFGEYDRITVHDFTLRAAIPTYMHEGRLSPYTESGPILLASEANKMNCVSHGGVQA